ncbi:MAG: c-type cytochrome biogenesis protein CcmI [Granulosicoccus sp.]
MTIFFICAALLVVLCLMWLLLGLFRQRDDVTDQEAVNITLARERGEILKAALADGSIDQTTYDYERQQLDYDLAADLVPDNKQPSIKGSGHISAAVIVAIFVPIASGALYLKLGNPAAITHDINITQQAASSGNATSAAGSNNAQLPGPLADLLPQLEQRLQDNPDDVQGWRLLGRSYLSLQNYPKAREALERARALDETNVDTLTQLAESIAMSRGGDLSGEAMDLLEQSISLNPQHEHTLWLRSIGKQQAGDHQEALLGFNFLMGLAQGNDDAIATIDQMRSRSIQALGANSIRQANQTQTDSDDKTAVSIDTQTPGISVTVSLSEEAAAAAGADQSVFIYATATNGPPMPLAVSRRTVSELPLSVVLDDSMAMIPNMKLSSFDEVTIGARVSASGNPIAQSGDWFVESDSITIEDTDAISLTIDQVTP